MKKLWVIFLLFPILGLCVLEYPSNAQSSQERSNGLTQAVKSYVSKKVGDLKKFLLEKSDGLNPRAKRYISDETEAIQKTIEAKHHEHQKKFAILDKRFLLDSANRLLALAKSQKKTSGVSQGAVLTPEDLILYATKERKLLQKQIEKIQQKGTSPSTLLEVLASKFDDFLTLLKMRHKRIKKQKLFTNEGAFFTKLEGRVQGVEKFAKNLLPVSKRAKSTPKELKALKKFVKKNRDLRGVDFLFISLKRPSKRQVLFAAYELQNAYHRFRLGWLKKELQLLQYRVSASRKKPTSGSVDSGFLKLQRAMAGRFENLEQRLRGAKEEKKVLKDRLKKLEEGFKKFQKRHKHERVPVGAIILLAGKDNQPPSPKKDCGVDSSSGIESESESCPNRCPVGYIEADGRLLLRRHHPGLGKIFLHKWWQKHADKGDNFLRLPDFRGVFPRFFDARKGKTLERPRPIRASFPALVELELDSGIKVKGGNLRFSALKYAPKKIPKWAAPAHHLLVACLRVR